MHKAHHVHFYPFAKITGIALNEIDQCFSTYEPRGASNVARHQRLHSPWPMGGGWRQSLSRFSGETKLPSLQRECPTFMTRMPEKILLPDPPLSWLSEPSLLPCAPSSGPSLCIKPNAGLQALHCGLGQRACNYICIQGRSGCRDWYYSLKGVSGRDQVTRVLGNPRHLTF